MWACGQRTGCPIHRQWFFHRRRHGGLQGSCRRSWRNGVVYLHGIGCSRGGGGVISLLFGNVGDSRGCSGWWGLSGAVTGRQKHLTGQCTPNSRDGVWGPLSRWRDVTCRSVRDTTSSGGKRGKMGWGRQAIIFNDNLRAFHYVSGLEFKVTSRQTCFPLGESHGKWTGLGSKIKDTWVHIRYSG